MASLAHEDNEEGDYERIIGLTIPQKLDWLFNVEQEEIFSGLSIVNSQVILIPFQVQKQIKLVSETPEKGSQESRY